VESFDGLLIDYVQQRGAGSILRGLRAVSDFEYEFQMALMNRRLSREVQTVFLMTDYNWMYLSSTIVKEVALHGGNVKGLVSEPVLAKLSEKYETLKGEQ
ncbi:MAG TPA: pantetheine-phosphate adenylyltransferase, partial [Humidesulfovibrio sp.]|uniref:pantetheine-phosphate adenylyltransferase n=1 Tax=Humidesulfovibrio sp. TaxID=2910988 RepID=UPI002C6FA8B7|nr:pantetheine-phosphate adenylyltransferase [Humidesulfovibrio sp.]